MDILCIGIGGVGQTTFMKYLNANLFQINHITDADGLKHLSHPEKFTNNPNNIKIIYIYNKTFDAICSLYRRNWAVIQMNKINGKENNKCHIHNVNKFFQSVETTLEDKFGCKQHFQRWYLYNFKNIYFLNMNQIDKIELSNFLKCDPNIFNELSFDNSKRNNYDKLKDKFKLSYIMYENIDNYIDNLSKYHNKLYHQT